MVIEIVWLFLHKTLMTTYLNLQTMSAIENINIINDPRSSIVQSVLDCRLSNMIKERDLW